MEGCHSPQPWTVSSSCGNDNLQGICRICKSKGRLDSPLISPCYCSGSMRYVHQTCLEKSIQNLGPRRCELCKFQFITHEKWKSGVQCFVCTFGFIILCCMILIVPTLMSLWIIINGMTESVSGTDLFFCWIILIACAFFLFLASVHSYTVFKKWRILNTTFYVQGAPENDTIAQQQLEKAIDSVPSQLSLSDSTSEEAVCLLPDEVEFQRCQSSVIRAMNDQNGGSNSVQFNSAKNTSDKIPTAETCPTESIPTSVRSNKLVPVAGNEHPLHEVAVILSSTDPEFGTEEQNYLS